MASELNVGSLGVGTAPYAPVTAEGAGTATGGAIGTEAVIVSKNTTAASHSAIAIDALDGYDSILYFGENGAERWNIRNDASDSDKFNIRDGSATRLTIDSAGLVQVGQGGATDATDPTLKVFTATVARKPIIELRNSTAGCQIEMPAHTNQLDFKTADTARLSISNAGLATFSSGINLGNTASATATTLDGYKEGTFTLSIVSGDGTISAQSGEYTRIGNCVFIRAVIQVSVNFSQNALSGLPYNCTAASSPSNWQPLGVALTQSTSDQPIAASAYSGAATISFFSDGSQATGHNPNTTQNYYRVNGFYYTTDAF